MYTEGIYVEINHKWSGSEIRNAMVAFSTLPSEREEKAEMFAKSVLEQTCERLGIDVSEYEYRWHFSRFYNMISHQ